MTETQPAQEFITQSRTVTWQRPGQGDRAALAGMNGLEQLRCVERGLIPRAPVIDTVDASGFQVEEGRVVVEMRAQEFHYNPLGSMHGGMIATLLDTAAGCAVHSTLAVGESYTSLDLTTKFLRTVTVASGLLRCEGTVVQRGRRTALAQAELRDEAGRLVAHATSTCMIFS